MPRVYIAGPMSGHDDYNYPAFHEAAQRWAEEGWEVENPATHFDGDQSLPYETYISAALSKVPFCDVLTLLPGWKNSRGARMERYVAEEMGKVIWEGARSPMALHAFEPNVCCFRPSFCHFGTKEPI